MFFTIIAPFLGPVKPSAGLFAKATESAMSYPVGLRGLGIRWATLSPETRRWVGLRGPAVFTGFGTAASAAIQFRCAYQRQRQFKMLAERLRCKRRIPPRRIRPEPQKTGEDLSRAAETPNCLTKKAFAQSSDRHFLRSQHVIFPQNWR